MVRLTMLCLSGFELYSRWVPLPKLESPVGIGGSNKENPFGRVGGGVWIFCGPVCFPFFYVQEMEIAAP